MTPLAAIHVGQVALLRGLTIGAPVLLASLAVGLAVSLLMAVTQVQETTLSFLPKLVAVALVLLWAGPWMLTQLMDLARALWTGGATG
jgi:flagellar biosynthetic protein FliQ